MRTTFRLFAAGVLLATTACKQRDAVADQQKATAVITGDDHLAASANGLCQMFSAAEASNLMGEAAGLAENAAMGSGCSWAGADGGRFTVAALSAADHEPPSAAQGFHKIAAPGKDGFVVPDMGGWVAGAVVGDKAIRVTLIGKAANEAGAIKALTDAASRSPLGGVSTIHVHSGE